MVDPIARWGEIASQIMQTQATPRERESAPVCTGPKRLTECGEEAWSVNREPMNKNRIGGVAKQGERARNRKALVTKAWAA
jgi:hypothetical protein